MTILKETGARPEELCLELTERCRDLDVTFLKNEVNFFHSKGIKIALDDFGTGNSSLSLALELPVDELKVDMSFIKDIEQKPQNQAMVQSIVDYANRTNTETCIEGIENQEVSDYIHQFGANLGIRVIFIPNLFRSTSLKHCWMCLTEKSLFCI